MTGSMNRIIRNLRENPHDIFLYAAGAGLIGALILIALFTRSIKSENKERLELQKKMIEQCSPNSDLFECQLYLANRCRGK